MTTDAGICETFRDDLQDLFTRELGLSPVQFDVFPRVKAVEPAGCKSPITESGIWEALKLVDQDKTPRFGGLPYEL